MIITFVPARKKINNVTWSKVDLSSFDSCVFYKRVRKVTGWKNIISLCRDFFFFCRIGQGALKGIGIEISRGGRNRQMERVFCSCLKSSCGFYVLDVRSFVDIFGIFLLLIFFFNIWRVRRENFEKLERMMRKKMMMMMMRQYRAKLMIFLFSHGRSSKKIMQGEIETCIN